MSLYQQSKPLNMHTHKKRCSLNLSLSAFRGKPTTQEIQDKLDESSACRNRENPWLGTDGSSGLLYLQRSMKLKLLKKKNPEMQSSILRVKENKCQDCDWNRKLTSKGSIQKNVCLVLSFLTPQTLVSPQETESHMTPVNSLTGNDIVERKFYDHNLLVSTWSETFL